MSHVIGSLSLATRQDDSDSLDIISGCVDTELHSLFETVSSDVKPDVRKFEKMQSSKNNAVHSQQHILTEM
jgi:hypothetical protein